MDSAQNFSTNGQFALEPATWRDLNTLRTVEKICFPLDAWPLWDLIGILTLPGVVRLKAVVADPKAGGDQMVGFVAGDVRRTEGLAWIATIGVLPEYRGRGIGAALLQACEEQAGMSIVRLCVRQSNQDAIRLYHRFGYTESGVWPRYYGDGENGLIMEKRR